MKIQEDTTRAFATRKGTIYSAPGESGREVRRLQIGEAFLASPKREGRWAEVCTPTGRKIGYTKAKRLSVGDEGAAQCVLSDFWGYVDPKRGRPYGQSQRRRQHTAPVVVTPTGDVVDGQHRVEAAKEVQVVHALERLADVVKEADKAPLPDPVRGRFAFFDRLCAMRERNHTTGRTGNDVNISEVRYKFATSLVRTAAVVGTVGYALTLASQFLG